MICMNLRPTYLQEVGMMQIAAACVNGTHGGYTSNIFLKGAEYIIGRHMFFKSEIIIN